MAFALCVETAEGCTCSRKINVYMAQKSERALNSGNCIGGVEVQAEMAIANWINISEAHEQDLD